MARTRGGEVGLQELAALAADPERAAQQGLGGGRVQQDQHPGLDHPELGLEPGEAGVDLLGVGLLVDAELAPAAGGLAWQEPLYHWARPPKLPA